MTTQHLTSRRKAQACRRVCAGKAGRLIYVTEQPIEQIILYTKQHCFAQAERTFDGPHKNARTSC